MCSNFGIRVVLNQHAYSTLLDLRRTLGHTINWGEALAQAELPSGIALFIPDCNKDAESSGLIAGTYADMRRVWQDDCVVLGENQLGTVYIDYEHLKMTRRDTFVLGEEALARMFNHAVSPVDIQVRELRAA